MWLCDADKMRRWLFECCSWWIHTENRAKDAACVWVWVCVYMYILCYQALTLATAKAVNKKLLQLWEELGSLCSWKHFKCGLIDWLIDWSIECALTEHATWRISVTWYLMTDALAQLKPNVQPISVTFSEIEVPKYEFYICKAQATS